MSSLGFSEYAESGNLNNNNGNGNGNGKIYNRLNGNGNITLKIPRNQNANDSPERGLFNRQTVMYQMKMERTRG